MYAILAQLSFLHVSCFLSCYSIIYTTTLEIKIIVINHKAQPSKQRHILHIQSNWNQIKSKRMFIVNQMDFTDRQRGHTIA